MRRISILILVFLNMILVTACGDEFSEDKKVKRSELREIAKDINDDFISLRSEIDEIVGVTKSLYSYDIREKTLKTVDKSQYELAANGVFYRKHYENNSAVFVSGFIPIDENIKEIVYFTEPLDERFQQTIDQYKEVAQIYYNERHSYNRIYPGFDVLTQYQSKIEVPSFNFYYLADEEHNPSKEAVWVNEPYVDPAGRGWMVSLIKPLYVNEQLEGVPGIDITISEITDRYLENDGDFMIVTSEGVIVTITEKLVNLFSLPPLKNHKYIETIKSDTYRVDNYNLLLSKNKSVRKLAKNLIAEGKNEAVFVKNNNESIVLSEKIPELNWTVISVVE